MVTVGMALFGIVPAFAATRTDIAVTKLGPTTAKPDTGITYTNNGRDTAANVTMTDTLPAGETFKSLSFHPGAAFTSCGLGQTISCSTPSLASGASIGMDVVVHISAGVPDDTVINNTATVSVGSADIDPNSTNNSATATTTVPITPGGGVGGDGGGGGINPGQTPELDSLLLFGSGLSGLAGYALLRRRSRRPEAAAEKSHTSSNRRPEFSTLWPPLSPGDRPGRGSLRIRGPRPVDPGGCDRTRDDHMDLH